MSATYGINLVCCAVFWGISGDAMKSLQYLLESNSCASTLTVASRRFSCILFLAFALTEDTRENILLTAALLTGVIRKVRAKVATFILKYTNPKMFSATGKLFFLNVASSQSMKDICLYSSAILLTLFPAWCIKGNSENIGFEISFNFDTGLNFEKLSNVSLAYGSLHVT
jgi:hypothetical protein